MRRLESQRGGTLVELMVAGMMMLLVGVGLLALMQGTYSSRDDIRGENTAFAEARQALDNLADNIRNGQPYVNGTVSQTIGAAGPTSVTVYNVNPSSGTADGTYYTAYSLNGSNLQKTVTTVNTPGTAVTLVPNVQSLVLNYYISDGSRNTRDYTQWNPSVTPNPTTSPASTYFPKIGAVSITVTITAGGYTRKMSSFVKLRNSPR